VTVPCQRAPICRRPADYCDTRCPEHKKPSGPEVDAEAWAARNAPLTCRDTARRAWLAGWMARTAADARKGE
jgi:hypothetical protein